MAGDLNVPGHCVIPDVRFMAQGRHGFFGALPGDFVGMPDIRSSCVACHGTAPKHWHANASVTQIIQTIRLSLAARRRFLRDTKKKWG